MRTSTRLGASLLPLLACGVIVLTLTAGWLSAGDWARLTIGGSLDRLAVPVPLSVRRRGPGIAPLTCGFWWGVTYWGCLLSIWCLAREPRKEL
jgi:hypothetical protein